MITDGIVVRSLVMDNDGEWRLMHLLIGCVRCACELLGGAFVDVEEPDGAVSRICCGCLLDEDEVIIYGA